MLLAAEVLTLMSFASPDSPIKAANYARMKLDLLRTRTMGLMEVLYSVQALHGLFTRSHQPLELEQFLSFVAEPLRRHPELQALAWSPYITDAGRVEYEARMKHSGTEGGFHIFDFHPKTGARVAPPRDYYIPLTYLAPLRENQVACGFDLASETRRLMALMNARDTGEPFATSPLHLVQEKEGQLGCLIVLPVYEGTPTTPSARKASLQGFVTAAFRITDMVDAFLNEQADPSRPVEVAVFDRVDPTQVICVRGATHSTTHGPGNTVSEWMDFAGARWRVSVSTVTQQDEVPRPHDFTAPYQTLCEDAMVGIFRTTAEGRYLFANRSMAHLYGYESPLELMNALEDIGSQLYVNTERRSEFVKLLQQHDVISGFESEIRHRDGRHIWISEKARAIRDQEGNLLYYEGVVEDITEQRLSQHALQKAYEELQARLDEKSTQLSRANVALSIEIEDRKRAEKAADSANEAKSVFLSHMSHEIRTPLNAVIGYTQILQKDVTLSEEQRMITDSLAAGSEHLMGLVENVLELSKIESGSMEVHHAHFDLSHLVASIESLFCHRCQQKKLQFSVTSLDKVCMVNGDAGLLRQVLINLLSNAVKFTDSGLIELVITRQAAEQWTFEVSDTGLGIEPELQQSIFEPFQQSGIGKKRGGTGLGLTILKRQVELMGGSLELRSSLGKGSRFIVNIPLSRIPFQEADTKNTGSLHLKENARVLALVVDDVEANRDLLVRMLRIIGCEVQSCDNGDAAIMMCRQLHPDIVFMDIWMPGMNGIEAAQILLKEFRKTPVKLVAHSATAFSHEANKYLETGFEDFFPKPFRFERLCECLQNLLPDRFESEEPAYFDQNAGGANCSTAPLSQAIMEMMKQAALDYNVTALKEALAILKQQHPDQSLLHDELYRLVMAFNMDAIIGYLHKDQDDHQPSFTR